MESPLRPLDLNVDTPVDEKNILKSRLRTLKKPVVQPAEDSDDDDDEDFEYEVSEDRLDVALNGPPSPWTREIDHTQPLTVAGEEETVIAEEEETHVRLEAEVPSVLERFESLQVPEGPASEEFELETATLDKFIVTEETAPLRPPTDVTHANIDLQNREKEPNLWSFCGALFNCS